MTWQHTPYTLPLLIAAGLSWMIAAYGAVLVRRGRVDRVILAFSALAVCAGAWSVASALQVASVELGAKLWYLRMQNTAGDAVVISWLAFAMAFTGYDRWLTRERLALLAIPGIVTVLFGWAEAGQGRIWTRASLDGSGSFVVLDWTPGVWFLLDTAYGHVLVVIGVCLIGRMALVTEGQYRQQAILVLAASVIPTVASLLFLSASGALGIDLTPLAFAVSAVLVAGAVFRYRFLDLVPIARDAVIEELRDGFVVLDGERRVVDTNRVAERILGESDSAVGRSTETVLGGWKDLLDAEGERTVREERAIEIDGERRWIEGRRSPVGGGQVEGEVLLFRDVTDRHRREEELQRANEGLEGFASVVSHDLRNPLNVAQGYLELVAESVDSDDSNAVERIDRAHERMGRIIDDTLALARSGGEIDRTEPVSLDTAARRAWEIVETGAATFELADWGNTAEDEGYEESEESERTEPSPWIIEADRDRLGRLLENLFRNSVEHGGSAVEVRVGPIEGGFFVDDNGPGIPPEQRETVLQAGHTTGESGTGLGLAIVKRITEAHGATVRVTESEGGGARFEFTGFEIGGSRSSEPANGGHRTIGADAESDGKRETEAGRENRTAASASAGESD